MVDLATCQDDANVSAVNVKPRGLEIVTDELNIDVAPRKHKFIDVDPNLYRELEKMQAISMDKLTSHCCMAWTGGLIRHEAADSNDTANGGQEIVSSRI
jgi:hypothetical protein